MRTIDQEISYIDSEIVKLQDRRDLLIAIKSIPIECFVNYLLDQGWQLATNKNANVLVFHNQHFLDINGRAIPLILPANMDYVDSYVLIEREINLLVILTKKNAMEIIREINNGNKEGTI